MKNKSGFTLIELLAVIVVLAIIMVIATISINRTIQKAREDSNDVNLEMIEDAVLLCMSQENDENKCDTVSSLNTNGYLDDFEDPFTNEEDPQKLDKKYMIEMQEDGKSTVYYIGNAGKHFCLNGDSDCFYTIGYSSKTLLALTEYNLNRSSRQAASSFIATKFSSSLYWQDSSASNGMNKNYGDPPAYIYDSNSDIYNYVQQYKAHLENDLGKDIIDARLVKYEELLALGCTPVKEGTNGSAAADKGSCKDYPFLTGRGQYGGFWTGTLSDYLYNGEYYYVYVVGSNMNLSTYPRGSTGASDTSGGFGIRPLIEIKRDGIEFR